MSITVRELIGWGLDIYSYRPGSCDPDALARARQRIAVRSLNAITPALLADETHATRLAYHACRPDLHAEMAGLDWSLGTVDLRLLLAFQRRLAFNPRLPCIAPPHDDAAALVAFCFGPPKPVAYRLIAGPTPQAFVLESADPNLHLRASSANPATPFLVHAGSPFFEVTHYRGRWLLRDGYHRAYALLRAGIFCVPAVLIEARTLEETGAAQPWFFPEDVLFGSTPPFVTDFLDDALILAYDRPALLKTLRVTVDETFTPAPPGEPS